ncbi:MAG: glycerol-3-phosphate dehydrogenase/oxidase [Bdellovibrionales bacterium]|nr:glycerol-3-phosphate dehydrogenase/oxidase [Bdellovibrionales bacterium]
MAILDRAAHLERLKTQEFDLLVIGGGITGAGIARDAAMRGLSVACIEARDFSSGTSSKSSKLLHGGIRYLEQFHLQLVFEASHERRLHSDFLSPHLAHPVPFMIPVYPWSPHGMLAMTCGVFLYDALAVFRNHGTRVMGREKALSEEPRLESKGLRGAAVYHDVVMDDSRLVIENVRSAGLHGATIANYVAMRGFDKDGAGKIRGVWVKDMTRNAADFRVRAKCYVNATGPWCDYIRRLDNPEAKPRLRPTKGVHLVLPPERLGKKHAFVLTAKADNRVFFSIPWFGRTLVGTTDTDYRPSTDGSLENLRAFDNEVDYLMESVKRTFPGADVSDGDICATFAGLRPLVSEDADNPSAVSREHLIWQEPSGLFNIGGGKYTTYRTMAQQMVDHVVKWLRAEYASFGGQRHECRTGAEPLVTAPDARERSAMKSALDEYAGVLGVDVLAHLQGFYGARWQLVADLAMARPELRERVVPTEPNIRAEVAYAREFEMAAHAEDFFRRRTQLALKAPLVRELGRVQGVAAEFGESVDARAVAEWQGLQDSGLQARRG